MTGIRTLADIEALETTPLAARGLAASTYEHLAQAVARTPEALALRFFLDAQAYAREHTWTFRALLADINRAANLFRAAGIGPRDVVSLVLPNLPETHFALWGAQAVGIANPMNPLLEPAQLTALLRAAGTRVLVTLAPLPGSDLYEKVLLAARDVPTLTAVFTVDVARYLPPPKRWAARLLTWRRRRQPTGRVRPRDFGHALRQQPATFQPRPIQPDDVAALFHTGGTSGAPKLARLTHQNLVFTAWAVAQTRSLADVRSVFCGLPLFHINGVQVTGLLPLGEGIPVVLGTPQGYRGPGLVANFWEIVDHYQVGSLSGVPTAYQLLLDAPRTPAQGRSLAFAVCGAAPCSVELLRRFEAQTGVPLLEGYGLTESACISTVNPGAGERRAGSVGLRLPYQQVLIGQFDGPAVARACAVGEAGAVLLRGPNVFAGYQEPRDEAGAWVEWAGARWFNTGDLGRLDAEGYLWLTGRRKELIIRGGHNIDPAIIEEALMQHPAVALAAAVGRPDPHAGEVPVAYVQLRPGHTATEAELLDFASARVAERAARPKAVRVLTALPTTAVGKIFKPALSRAESERAFSDALHGLGGLRAVTVETQPEADQPGGRLLVRWSAQPGADAAAVRARIEQQLGQFTLPYILLDTDVA